MPSPNTLPTAIEKRDIIHGKRKGADLRALGERFLEAGRLAEAIDFLERAEGGEIRLGQVRDLAVAAGDGFLLERIAKARPALIEPVTWERAGDAAIAAGKLRHAVRCFERAGPGAEAKLVDARTRWNAFMGRDPDADPNARPPGAGDVAGAGPGGGTATPGSAAPAQAPPPPPAAPATS